MIVFTLRSAISSSPLSYRAAQETQIHQGFRDSAFDSTQIVTQDSELSGHANGIYRVPSSSSDVLGNENKILATLVCAEAFVCV